VSFIESAKETTEDDEGRRRQVEDRQRHVDHESAA
jgi:hypothetical protein